MRKKTVYFFVVLLLLSVGLISVPKTFSQTQNIKVKILSYSYYIDPEGILDVVGEIQNEGTSTLSQVSLSGSIYSGTALLDNSVPKLT